MKLTFLCLEVDEKQDGKSTVSLQLVDGSDNPTVITTTITNDEAAAGAVEAGKTYEAPLSVVGAPSDTDTQVA